MRARSCVVVTPAPQVHEWPGTRALTDAQVGAYLSLGWWLVGIVALGVGHMSFAGHMSRQLRMWHLGAWHRAQGVQAGRRVLLISWFRRTAAETLDTVYEVHMIDPGARQRECVYECQWNSIPTQDSKRVRNTRDRARDTGGDGERECVYARKGNCDGGGRGAWSGGRRW